MVLTKIIMYTVLHDISEEIFFVNHGGLNQNNLQPPELTITTPVGLISLWFVTF